MADMHRWMAEDEARRDDAANAKKAAVEPDGKNPLARVDLSSDESGFIYPVCDCGAVLPLPTNIEVNLQDLVMAAGDHGRTCPLHHANLAAIEKEKNRD